VNASFAIPMKSVRDWQWENTWLVWTLLALLVLPLATALITVPALGSIYGGAGSSVLALVMACGFGWGCAQVLFGLAINSIGVGLAFSTLLGVSAAVGSLIPALQMNAAIRPS
jgi:L-rhamnose-H+ transport protein